MYPWRRGGKRTSHLDSHIHRDGCRGKRRASSRHLARRRRGEQPASRRWQVAWSRGTIRPALPGMSLHALQHTHGHGDGITTRTAVHARGALGLDAPDELLKLARQLIRGVALTAIQLAHLD